jgi:uncharacterized protein YqhQ
MKKQEKITVGGQAVMEGVMMRGPKLVAVAVRKPDGSIVVKHEPFESITKRIKFLGLPLLRGAVVLIESLILGIRALTFSGDVAMESEKKPVKRGRLDSMWMALTLIIAFVIGLGLFFYVPLLLTDLTGVKSGILFNLVDGIFRLTIFLLYIYCISLFKDIRRVFEYHGAEHKSIFAYEDNKKFGIEFARPYKTLHPRCGTSFLLIVMIVSILLFMLLGRPDSIGDRLVRILLVPLIGGISYELIKLSDKSYKSKFFRFFIVPGLWLQKITTKEPDDNQLEVALVALKCALGEEPSAGPSKVELIG